MMQYCHNLVHSGAYFESWCIIPNSNAIKIIQQSVAS